MNVSSGKLVWLTFKWVAVPLGLGAVGYYVVGPRIGQVPALEKGARKVQDLVQGNSSPTASKTEEPPASDPRAPDIQIAVEKADRDPRRRRSSTSTRRRSSESTRKPAPEKPVDERTDPASGAGAVPPTEPPATTGGTGTTGATGDGL